MSGKLSVHNRPSKNALGNPAVLTVLFALLTMAGCSDAPRFRINSVHRLTVEKEFLDGEKIAEEPIRQLGNVMTALFGTPDQPRFPAGYESLIDSGQLQQAAGPVGDDRASGLYRLHCAHCHGISGDGQGPTAASLNPYPRDFRLGKFKFKSTRMYRPPTDEDLRRVLHRGIAGTAMPSFAMLGEEQIEALVDYVKYLSIRGQTERTLLEELTRLEPEEPLLPARDEDPDEYEYALEWIMEKVDSIAGKWAKADSYIVAVPDLPRDFAFARDRYATNGKQLFFGKANCVQCHGETGVGDGQTDNYDDWTNEWLKRSDVDPSDTARLQEFLQAGALPPRQIHPRNLRNLVFRGGSQPDDLFRRIRAGIEGTNMPAAPALSNAEIWSIVAYLLDLPYQTAREDR
jgi:mono/diheme cytochrome c family protein